MTIITPPKRRSKKYKELHPELYPEKVKVLKKRGRPEHEPTEQTRNTVSMMSAFGLRQYEIAQLMGMKNDTLVKHYSHELDTGLNKAIVSVASKVYKTAVSDKNNALNAAMFFLKTRGGWRENNTIELTGPNGGPIQTQSIDIDVLDIDQQEQLEAMLTAVLALPPPSEEIVYEAEEEDEEEDA